MDIMMVDMVIQAQATDMATWITGPIMVTQIPDQVAEDQKDQHILTQGTEQEQVEHILRLREIQDRQQ
jgi:hypothetical protein